MSFSYWCLDIMYALFSTLRVYVISERNWCVSLLVFALALVPLVSDIYHFCNIKLVTLSPFSGFTIAARASLVMSDAIVLLVILRKTYHIQEIIRQTHAKASLSSLLLRDGSFYFVMLFALNTLDVTFWVTNGFTYVDLYVSVLTTLTLSRCIRNLRGALIGNHDVSFTISSDAHFVSQPVSSLATVPHTVDGELEEP
ncbi:uncharacterized protein FIBRA_02650 [Fibroporia radiculosa]|uniref:Uncharacterized protein n=1 Tax=Fibroporia radiculosa TaxID=599839 RepID=J4H1Z1_9APHY|nr:uncharacterized protein FIBRA_02650 [Fibroporia radiculosa]CCM00614.1 predicted protein [Fibroporia radiculosa]